MVLNQTQGDKATTSRGIDGGSLTAMWIIHIVTKFVKQNMTYNIWLITWPGNFGAQSNVEMLLLQS